MKMMKPPTGVKVRATTPRASLMGPAGVPSNSPVKGMKGSQPRMNTPRTSLTGPNGSPSNSPATAIQESQPKAPGGQGFLQVPHAFTDARPPGRMGARKSTGYPNPTGSM